MGKKRNLRAVGHRVLVKLKKIEKTKEIKSESGIVIELKTTEDLDLEQEAHVEAYIMDIGPQAWKAFDNGEPWAELGDCILIAKYCGIQRKDIEDNEIYRLIRDDDVLGVFGDEKCL